MARNGENIFGSRLRSLRQNMGSTQQEVADALGMDRSTLNKYETGDRVPNMVTVKRLALFYGVSVDELTSVPEEMIPVALDNLLAGDTPLTLYGRPLDDNARRAITAAIKIVYETQIEKE
ncbi:MAG: helix-turn-helix domain-containing protein [Christensenellales bacterium]|jgi:transcriptional regulator with XRE-family HTH domain